MFWNKKKEDKSLPELPPLKQTFGAFETEEIESRAISEEDIPKKATELPELPESSEFSPEEKLPELPSKFKMQKMPQIQDFESRPRISEFRPSKNEDIYVRLDKFTTAKKTLFSARDKLYEIEELMRQIRETRMREEQELNAWEKDIDTIKIKISDVTKNIFEKIE